MKVVIQRVSEASVTINQNIKSKIGKGLLILLGIEDEDTSEDIKWLCNKVSNRSQPIHFTRQHKKRKSSILPQSIQTKCCYSSLRKIRRRIKNHFRTRCSNWRIRRRHESPITQRRPSYHHHRFKK